MYNLRFWDEKSQFYEKMKNRQKLILGHFDV